MRVEMARLLLGLMLFLIPFVEALWEQKGITFTNGKYCPEVKFDSEKSDLSLTNLASTGKRSVSQFRGKLCYRCGDELAGQH